MPRLQHTRLLVSRYPSPAAPTIHSGGVSVTELPGEGAHATEFRDDMFGLGHDSVLRFSRKIVNVETVSGNGQRVSRKELLPMHVTEKLRDLRTRAGLSMNACAKALGFKGPSSYQRYESPELFKDEYLPLEIVRKLAPLFAEHGIPKEDLLALAGLPDIAEMAQSGQEASVPLDRLRMVVKALAEYRSEERLSFTPSEEAEMIVSFCRWFGGEIAAGRQTEPISIESAKSLLRLLDSRRAH